jgi:hypothetical protein
VSTRGRAFTISDVHAYDFEGLLGSFQQFSTFVATDINYVSSGERVRLIRTVQNAHAFGNRFQDLVILEFAASK